MFSIVIPVFNEARNIEKLLLEIEKSLINFTEYEIILVNDASIDDTVSVIKKINIKNIKIINNDGTNIYDLFKYKNVILTLSSIKKIENRILNEKN